MRLREKKKGRRKRGRGREGGGRAGGGVARGKEVDGKEEAAAEETKVLLGGRTKGGWVLSRFALHAPELCAEVEPGKTEREKEKKGEKRILFCGRVAFCERGADHKRDLAVPGRRGGSRLST